MEKEQSRAVSIDYIGGKDVMPIGAYFGPYVRMQKRDELPYLIEDQYFQWTAEAGINLITYAPTDYRREPEAMKKYLELCHKYHIGTLVTDSNILRKADGELVTEEEVRRELKAYCDEPAYCGLYLIDEPDGPRYKRRVADKWQIRYFGKLAEVLQHKMNIFCYINALPCNPYPAEKELYKEYLTEFCETLRPRVLMWDFYVYGESATKEAYFWNMGLIREQAIEANIPFWAFIQAGGQWHEDDDYAGGDYFPNEGEFFWNVNTCLASGAQGIQYFTLMQPTSFPYVSGHTEGDFRRNGLIGCDGKKNQWYDYAKKINAQIAEIDEVLMHSVHKGILVSGKQAGVDTKEASYVIEGGFRELKSVQGEALTGCFNYGGKTALYVVNYSTVAEEDIVLTFDQKYNIRMVKETKHFNENADVLTLHMAAGEGALLVIESTGKGDSGL